MKWTTEHINRIAQKVIDRGGTYDTLTYRYYVVHYANGAWHLWRCVLCDTGHTPPEDLGATTIFNQPKRG